MAIWNLPTVIPWVSTEGSSYPVMEEICSYPSLPLPLMICFAASPSSSALWWLFFPSLCVCLLFFFFFFNLGSQGNFFEIGPPSLLQVTLRHSALSFPSCISDSEFNFKVLESFPLSTLCSVSFVQVSYKTIALGSCICFSMLLT